MMVAKMTINLNGKSNQKKAAQKPPQAQLLNQNGK